MDVDHLPSDPQMDLDRLPNHFEDDAYAEFLDDNQQYRTLDPAVATAAGSVGPVFRNHYCLDPHGPTVSADSLKTLKTLKGFSLTPTHSTMSAFSDHAAKAHSQERPGHAGQDLTFPDAEVSFPWDNSYLFNAMSDPTAFWTGDRPQDRLANSSKVDCDEDCVSVVSCTSRCGISCPSQCGDTGHGVCCDDDACSEACEDSQDLCLDETCENAATPCTDVKCSGLAKLDHFPNEAMSDGDKEAAAALASIGDTHPAPIQDGFQPFHSNINFGSHSCFLGSTCSHTLPHGCLGTAISEYNFGQFWENLHQENPLATHILQYHDPRNTVDHVRPCMADHPDLAIPKCTLPRAVVNGDFLSHGFSYNSQDPTCGFEVNTIDQFANHLFEDHWQMQIVNSDLFGLPQTTQVEDRFSLVPSRSSISSYSFNTASTSGPQLSPSEISLQNMSAVSSIAASPTSRATTPLAHPEELTIDAPSTETAPISATVSDAEPAVDCICQWKMVGDKICGMRFKDANDLHTHTKNDHLKDMSRQHPGFCCQWHGCTRTNVFGQKSKLERHIQTHTGYKPVKCSVCGLQLSAKQSLDQHMRTHTGEKPWKCKFPGCTHAFKQQSALTMHERTHTGYKPLPDYQPGVI
ncbi:hypothetical protein MKX08_001518 [Trichoderma sp. CBMAI-0020]|nr:hypothetical protein MKX08_001518 [Trichoderma sp. CBMAI-0020]WOD46490.1 zinc-finger protein [Trichoderma atroviride]